jgi:diguanylate cyclase (GGDEF)-like protein
MDHELSHKILHIFLIVYTIILILTFIGTIVCLNFFSAKYANNQHADAIDPITMLYDKAAFEPRILSALQFYKYYDVVSSLIFLEINNFNDITNELPPAKINELLMNIANNFRQTARTNDVLFRLRKSEFVVIAKCNINDALKASQRYQQNIKNVEWKKDTPITINISLSEILKTDAKKDILQRIQTD